MQAEKIVSIKPIGSKQTLDIEIEDKNHIFFGNGIATSNSHSYSYGKLGYLTAYAKYHATTYFFLSWLDKAKDKLDPKQEVNELVNDAKFFNVEVFGPNFRDLQSTYYTDGVSIWLGLSAIKGVGESVLDKILSKKDVAIKLLGKEVKDWSWLDFLFVFSNNINSAAVKALISAGALSYLNKPRLEMIYEHGKWCDLTEKEQDWIINRHLTVPFTSLIEALTLASVPKKEGGGASNKNRTELLKNLVQSLQKPPFDLKDYPDRIAFDEEKLLGVALTFTKIDACNTKANSTIKELLSGKNDKYLTLDIEIKKIREYNITKGQSKGKKMAFVTVNDGTGELDNCVAFPETYKEFQALLIPGNTLMVNVQKNEEKNSFVIQKAWQI